MNDWRAQARRLGFWVPTLSFGRGATPGGCNCCDSVFFGSSGDSGFSGSSGSSGSSSGFSGSSGGEPTYETAPNPACGNCEANSLPAALQLTISGVSNPTLGGCDGGCANDCSVVDGSYIIPWTGGCVYQDEIIASDLCLEVIGNPSECGNLAVVIQIFGGVRQSIRATFASDSTVGSDVYTNSNLLDDINVVHCLDEYLEHASFPVTLTGTPGGGAPCDMPASVEIDLVPA